MKLHLNYSTELSTFISKYPHTVLKYLYIKILQNYLDKNVLSFTTKIDDKYVNKVNILFNFQVCIIYTMKQK